MKKQYTNISIDGLIDVSENPISTLDLSDKFIEFIEANNWYFGGGMSYYTEEDEERDIREIIDSLSEKKYKGKRHRTRIGKRQQLGIR